MSSVPFPVVVDVGNTTTTTTVSAVVFRLVVLLLSFFVTLVVLITTTPAAIKNVLPANPLFPRHQRRQTAMLLFATRDERTRGQRRI